MIHSQVYVSRARCTWRHVALAAALLAGGCQSPASRSPYLAGLELLPLPQMTYQLAVSPDGTRLAYSEPQGLFVLDLATSSTKKLADSEGPISSIGWTGDGKTVAFLPVRRPPVVEPGEPKLPPGPDYAPGRLQMVKVDSGVISMPAIAAGTRFQVSPSPDGRYLAVMKESGLFLYDVGRDQETPLSSRGYLGHVAWAPDSQRLAYVEFDENREAHVLIVSALDKQMKRLDGTGIHLNRMGVEMGCWPEEEKVSWTGGSDRLHVVQSRTPRSFGITTFALDGHRLEDRILNVADAADSRRYVDCYHPSPDGRFVVALKMSGESAIPEPSAGLIGIETETGQVRDVAPPSTLVGWLGRTSRFVLMNNQTGYTRYYVADAARSR